MRFHVPNNIIDEYQEQKLRDKGGESGQDDNSDEEEITAAKLFNDKIIQKANIGQFAGAVVTSI